MKPITERRLLNEFETALMPTNSIKEVLQGLAVPCCIATSSSPKRTIKRAWLTLGNTLIRYLPQSEVKNDKPAPIYFYMLLNKWALSHKICLVIEDSKAGVCAALAANMQCCITVAADICR
ncbi:HAD-IA family hydrolase (plasmid) [Pseudoalteromonas espejiana]